MKQKTRAQRGLRRVSENVFRQVDTHRDTPAQALRQDYLATRFGLTPSMAGVHRHGPVGARMSAPTLSPERAAMTAHTFDAVAEAAAIAEAYARTAAEFAALGDARGLAYALRCATSAILNATEIATTLRPTCSRGGA